MRTGQTLILHGGGLRSLVATASVAASLPPGQIVLLHVRERRDNQAIRLAHVHRQAQHFSLRQVVEVNPPELLSTSAIEGGVAGSLPLATPLIHLIALAQGVGIQAQRVVAPSQFNADFERVAAFTESLVLLQHLARLEGQTLPAIETPLLELSDAQLIELGAQLQAPWELAWSCETPADKPCGHCGACQRRRQAFDAAGLVEPDPDVAELPPSAAGSRQSRR